MHASSMKSQQLRAFKYFLILYRLANGVSL